MKIALVSEYYYPVLGGITEHVYYLASNLSKKGHDVTVITGNYVGRNGHHMPERQDFRVKRVGWGLPVYSNGSFARITVGRLGAELRELFSRERFDIIHAHSPLTPILPLIAIRNSNALATVGTFHTYFDRSRGYSTLKKESARHMDMLDGRIVVSETCIEALSRYFDTEYALIPNGVDTDCFRPDAAPVERFDDGKLNILFVGRFDPRNGLRTMLEAFRIVRGEFPGCRLIIVGDGPLRAYYRRFVDDTIADDVHFEGLINGGRPAYYASADIYCTPCTKSSFGVVLIEAMSAAVPIVASRNNGYESVMEDGRQGVFVPGNDPGAFAGTLLELLRDPERRRQLGAGGRRTAMESYSWNLVTDAVESYYLELLDGTARPADRGPGLTQEPISEPRLEKVPALHE